MKVKILPKSQRAKNRVKEHGEVMTFEDINLRGNLFKSLEKTWNGPDGKDFWSGWFTDEDADFVKVEE